jgi:preprotein translocase subunit SecA
MDKLDLEEGQVIEHPWVTKSIEIAQKRVEQHNFEIRKQLLEYDNVMNKQREVIYAQRRQILEGASLKEDILEIMDKKLDGVLSAYVSDNVSPQEFDRAGFLSAVKLSFGLEIDKSSIEGKDKNKIKQDLYQRIFEAYTEKEKAVGEDLMRHLERMVFLQIIDSKWKDHLYAMDTLREGIGLRAYGQRDPLIEYKREAFEYFSQMIASIEEESTEAIFKLQPVKPERIIKGVFSSISQELLHPQITKFEKPEEQPLPVSVPPSVKPSSKVGRNDPCPCGAKDPNTGNPIKYKKCHGR